MIKIEELPLTIGNWYRKSNNSDVYLCKDKDGLAAIVNTNKGIISFGFYKPCGVNIGKVSVSSVDDVVSIIKDFKY